MVGKYITCQHRINCPYDCDSSDNVTLSYFACIHMYNVGVYVDVSLMYSVAFGIINNDGPLPRAFICRPIVSD